VLNFKRDCLTKNGCKELKTQFKIENLKKSPLITNSIQLIRHPD
jgi:hypothetical protein